MRESCFEGYSSAAPVCAAVVPIAGVVPTAGPVPTAGGDGLPVGLPEAPGPPPPANTHVSPTELPVGPARVERRALVLPAAVVLPSAGRSAAAPRAVACVSAGADCARGRVRRVRAVRPRAARAVLIALSTFSRRARHRGDVVDRSVAVVVDAVADLCPRGPSRHAAGRRRAGAAHRRAGALARSDADRAARARSQTRPAAVREPRSARACAHPVADTAANGRTAGPIRSIAGERAERPHSARAVLHAHGALARNTRCSRDVVRDAVAVVVDPVAHLCSRRARNSAASNRSGYTLGHARALTDPQSSGARIADPATDTAAIDLSRRTRAGAEPVTGSAHGHVARGARGVIARVRARGRSSRAERAPSTARRRSARHRRDVIDDPVAVVVDAVASLRLWRSRSGAAHGVHPATNPSARHSAAADASGARTRHATESAAALLARRTRAHARGAHHARAQRAARGPVGNRSNIRAHRPVRDARRRPTEPARNARVTRTVHRARQTRVRRPIRATRALHGIDVDRRRSRRDRRIDHLRLQRANDARSKRRVGGRSVNRALRGFVSTADGEERCQQRGDGPDRRERDPLAPRQAVRQGSTISSGLWSHRVRYARHRTVPPRSPPTIQAEEKKNGHQSDATHVPRRTRVVARHRSALSERG